MVQLLETFWVAGSLAKTDTCITVGSWNMADSNTVSCSQCQLVLRSNTVGDRPAWNGHRSGAKPERHFIYEYAMIWQILLIHYLSQVFINWITIAFALGILSNPKMYRNVWCSERKSEYLIKQSQPLSLSVHKTSREFVPEYHREYLYNTDRHGTMYQLKKSNP